MKNLMIWLASIASILGFIVGLYGLSPDKFDGLQQTWIHFLEWFSLIAYIACPLLIIALFILNKKQSNTVLQVSGILSNWCKSSHYHSHTLRDTVMEIKKLESESIQSIAEKIPSQKTYIDDAKKVKNGVFKKLEKLVCDNCGEIATFLTEDIHSIITLLGFQEQKVRVLVKTIDDETSINPDGNTRYLNFDTASFKSPICDVQSWSEIKPKIRAQELHRQQKNEPAEKSYLKNSTALSRVTRDKSLFFVSNNIKSIEHYEPEYSIYEDGFRAKLAFPIQYKGNPNGRLLLGFLVVLIDNEKEEEIYKDDIESLLISLSASVADSLAIILAAIHNSNSTIKEKINTHCASLKQNRRFNDNRG